jgi:RNA polymerase sigma factor (sigma-70 family)
VTLRVHDRFGPYELLAALGERGLGEVWKARDSADGRLVALRILPNPPSADPRRFARFEHDIRKLESWTHSNIAAVHGLIDVDGVRALAFEWVDGPSLAELLSMGALPVDEVVSVSATVATALASAHARDLVHGDVKPSNIKVCTDGAVKILDFSLADVFAVDPAGPSSSIASARMMAAITGTAAYMSPEQLRGAYPDARADVWAFGCVVYEMLTGRAAFASEELGETIANVCESEPEWTRLPPATPALIGRMLRGCLDKNPETRFQQMADALAPIREAIAQEGALEAYVRELSLQSDVGKLLETELPRLKRWARGRVPASLGIDASEIVEDVVLQAVRSLKEFSPRSEGALSAYLREAVRNRIRDLTRRQSRRTEESDPDDDDNDAEVQYREALDQLSEQDRSFIISRLDDGSSYEDIARRFSLPDASAARMAVSRALRRLADIFARKK